MAVVGAAGAVGSAAAYSLVLNSAVEEVLLFNRTRGLAEVLAMDLEQVCARQEHPCTARAVGVDDLGGADLIIFAASIHPKEGMSHADFTVPNAAIARTVIEQMRKGGVDPRRLLVTSAPVEPLTTYFFRELDLERESVIGYTLNDTSRLRVAIGRALDVDPRTVTAWSLGELGSSRVPLLGRVSVDGERVELDSAAREKVTSYLDAWFPEWMKRAPTRTSAWMTGHGLSMVISAMAAADPGEWPMAYPLQGEYGIEDVAVSVPARLSAAPEPIEWELEEDEAAALAKAAEDIRAVVARIYDEVGAPRVGG